jgi:hypothetical protein
MASEARIDEWQRQIRGAQSPEALLAVVRRFLASLPPDELHRLPPSSKPHDIRDLDELAALNVQLAKDELMFSGEAETRALMRRMIAVLGEATNRLVQFPSRQ